MHKFGILLFVLSLIFLIGGITFYTQSFKQNDADVSQGPTDKQDEGLENVIHNSQDDIYQEKCIENLCYKIDSLAFSDSVDYDMGEMIVSVTNRGDSVVPKSGKNFVFHTSNQEVVVPIVFGEIAIGESQQAMANVSDSSIVDATSYDILEFSSDDIATYLQ